MVTYRFKALNTVARGIFFLHNFESRLIFALVLKIHAWESFFIFAQIMNLWLGVKIMLCKFTEIRERVRPIIRPCFITLAMLMSVVPSDARANAASAGIVQLVPVKDAVTNVLQKIRQHEDVFSDSKWVESYDKNSDTRRVLLLQLGEALGSGRDILQRTDLNQEERTIISQFVNHTRELFDYEQKNTRPRNPKFWKKAERFLTSAEELRKYYQFWQ